MRFAYADPPYLGHGKKDYGEYHPDAGDWDHPEAHVRLVQRLVDEYPDGWVVSLDVPSLRLYLQHVPAKARVGVWCKTMHTIFVSNSVQYAWEPVIWHGGRTIKNRNPMVRDWLRSVTARTGLKGAKPREFNRWVLELLGFQPGDEIDDLFPGTGSMQQAINQDVLPFWRPTTAPVESPTLTDDVDGATA